MNKPSEALREYCELLTQLHLKMRMTKYAQLMIADDDLKCDAIRDKMDDPWKRMTTEERETSRHLSALLYQETNSVA